jgi:hypothetical protein
MIMNGIKSIYILDSDQVQSPARELTAKGEGYFY